jgi:acyl carrier protein
MNQTSVLSGQEMTALLSEIIGAAPGVVRGDALLAELPGWDSLAILEVMIRMDELYDVKLSPEKFVHCRTVDDLFDAVLQEIQTAAA